MDYKEKKEIALKLAREIASNSPNQSVINTLENLLEIDDDQSVEFRKTGEHAPIEVSRRIGIWEPKIDESGKEIYERNIKYSPDFYLWAKMHQFHKEKSKFRIVLIGESVARGFLYDPLYTPALALQSMLEQQIGLDVVEVLDLARTNLLGDEMVDLYRNICTELNPDLVLIWCGNNWKNDIDFTKTDFDTMLGCLDHQDRFKIIFDIFKQRYEEKVSERISRIDSIRQTGYPVLYLIPEINLLDWYPSPKDSIVSWPTGSTSKWKELKEKIENALQEERFDAAEDLCHPFIELDPFNPNGYDFLARCLYQRGDVDTARKLLIKSKDMGLFQLHGVPQCLSVVREKIQAECVRFKIPNINIREALRNHFSIDIAGKDIFVDYCHHSSSGIEMVMSVTANYILKEYFFINVQVELLKTYCVKPPKNVEAVANFLGAIHSSHKGEQPLRLLYYYSHQALNASTEVKELMFNFIDFVTRRKPWFLSKSYLEFLQNELVGYYVMLFIQPDGASNLLDVELIKAMMMALKDFGYDLRSSYNALIVLENEPVQSISLLESKYSKKSLQKVSDAFVNAFEPDRNYYKAEHFESNFILIGDNVWDYKIEIICRIPFSQADDQLVIAVNGETITAMPARLSWQKHSFIVCNSVMREDGINSLTIKWPFLDEKMNEIAKIYQRVYSSNLEYIFRLKNPCYGEIATLQVTRVCSLNMTEGALDKQWDKVS